MLCSLFFFLLFFLQPSHGDKAANPKVLKWMTDLTKIRRQIKGKTTRSFRFVLWGLECLCMYILLHGGQLDPRPFHAFDHCNNMACVLV